MLYALLSALARLCRHTSLRALTLVITTLFLLLLVLLTSITFHWPTAPTMLASSGNAITWQNPKTGPVGTVASITGFAEPFPIGSVFDLDLRPGAGQTYADYQAICTSATLPKVFVGQVKTSSTYSFAKTFNWPSAAGQLGPWSMCSYQTSGSGAGQMATIVQYYNFTVTVSPTPTPRPPTPTSTATPLPRPKPTPKPTAAPTATATATVLPTLTATTQPAIDSQPTSSNTPPPSPPSSGLPVVLLTLAAVLGALLVGGGAFLALRRRQHQALTPPPLV